MQGTGGLIYLAVLVIAFYLLIIRPQMQRAKQVRELIASLEVGDRVVTVGGMHAAIVTIAESTVVLRVADGVDLTFDRAAIGRKVKAEDAAVSSGS